MAAQVVEQKFYFVVAACWDSKEQTNESCSATLMSRLKAGKNDTSVQRFVKNINDWYLKLEKRDCKTDCLFS